MDHGHTRYQLIDVLLGLRHVHLHFVLDEKFQTQVMSGVIQLVCLGQKEGQAEKTLSRQLESGTSRTRLTDSREERGPYPGGGVRGLHPS